MRRTPLLLVPVLMGVLSGCGGEQPVGSDQGLPLSSGDQRLLGLYRQDAREVSRRVRIPDGATRLRIRSDCIADDDSPLGQVTIGDVGLGSLACNSTSRPGGFIKMSGRDFGRFGTQTVTVRAPEGARWSVAIDAG